MTCDSQPGGIRILPPESGGFRRYVTLSKKSKGGDLSIQICRSLLHVARFDNTIKFYLCIK